MSKPMTKVKTPEGRVSFPKLFEPSAFPNQKPKYSVQLLIPKTVDISALKNLVAETAKAKWPDATKRPKKIINPIKDGDTDEMDSGELRCEKYPEVKGHWIISASSLKRVPVVDRQVMPIMDEADFYSGCYASMVVTAFAYAPSKDKPQSKSGVSFGLQGIQKLREGEAFTGGSKAEDMFTALTDDTISTSPAEAGADSMFG